MRLLFFPSAAALLLTWHLTREPDRDFMNAASRANLTELSAARLALIKSGTLFVKNFAQKMTEDHAKAQQELTSLARQENVILATSPDTEHQHMLEQLARLSGHPFDSAYLQMQLLDHQVAVDLFRQETRQGRDDAAKAYAAKYLPDLEHHLEMLKQRFSGAH